MDAWDKWQVVCLALLSLEDIEDVYLFGFMIAGHLFLALSIALVYRKIGKTTAIQGVQRLSVNLNEMGRGVSTQTMVVSELNRKMDNILEKLATLQGEVILLRSRTNFKDE